MKHLNLIFALALTVGCTSPAGQIDRSSSGTKLLEKQSTTDKAMGEAIFEKIEQRMDPYPTFSYQLTEPVNLIPLSANTSGELSTKNGCYVISKKTLLKKLPEETYGATRNYLAVFYSNGRDNLDRLMPTDEASVKKVENITVQVISSETVSEQSDIVFNNRALDCISKFRGSMDIALIGISKDK